MPIKLMYITNEPDIAAIAEASGVERIFIDLEVLGKAERQKTIKSFISDHRITDIGPVKKRLTQAELMVRVNPLNSRSESEIDSVIRQNPDVVMLPMFKKYQEVQEFIRLVDGRAQVSLLLETMDAVNELDLIINTPGIDEIHVGLNDLHLSLTQKFLFEPVATGMIESIARKVKGNGIRFGFGGMGRIGQGMVPAEMILAEHYRIRSEMVILSRSFREEKGYKELAKDDWLKKEIQLIREKENEFEGWDLKQFQDNYIKMCRIIRSIAGD